MTEHKPNVKDRMADTAYGWCGLRPDGRKCGIDPLRFALWSVAMHPEHIGDIDDPNWHLPKLWVVFTKEDAEYANDPSMEGAVMVTIDPPNVTSYQQAALNAAIDCPEHKDSFAKLAELFKAEGFD